MVIESEAMNNMTDWKSQTNWTIASGSLQECITFESSLSLADEGGDGVAAVTPDSAPNSPLILYPASSDSGPCEIKINFAQKHEVLQVYVRSTARVYEIYCEPDVQISNEYLCTVRCGIAARDGEVLHALNVEEVVSSHIKGFNKGLAEENSRSEDDWVDVKFPDSPGLDGGNHGLQIKSCTDSSKSCQDLFEATAEISDVNPCTSVTLRLLSLQNKSSLYIDEIYIFADPTDSETQGNTAENSSSSSLMSMFLPTLMHAMKNVNEKDPPVRKEKQYFPEVDLGKSHPCGSVIKTQLEGRSSKTDHQEGELQKVNVESVGPSQSDNFLQDAPVDCNVTTTSQAALMESNQNGPPSQAAETKINNRGTPSLEKNRGDSMGSDVERALAQLVSRMDRMEAICLGFQEKMLMPISSIEARLQQVEQQLETLTIKLQNSGSPSCSRIHAPDGSCIQSDANTCDNCDGNVTEVLKPDKNDSHTEVLSVSPIDVSDSENTTQVQPGLIVTAPEFLDAEDEEENKTPVLETASNDKQRQPLSIDDAVASAFAGFLSSVSSETPKYTKSLVVRAPEFINEDDHENDDASPRISHETEKNSKESDGTVKESEQFCHHNAALDDQKEVCIEAVKESEPFYQHSTAEDDQKEVCVEAVKGSEEFCQDNTAVDDQKDGCVETVKEPGQFCPRSTAEDDQKEERVETGILAEHTSDENESRDIIGQINYGLSSTSDIPDLCQTDSTSSGAAKEEVCVNTDHTDTIATEVPKKASHEDIIENFLGFSRGSSMLDFETSILDVKFSSQGNHVTKSFLETLVDTPETTSSEDHPVEENKDYLSINEHFKTNGKDSVAEQNSLITIGDTELVNPYPNGHFSVPVVVNGDNLQERKRKRMEEDKRR